MTIRKNIVNHSEKITCSKIQRKKLCSKIETDGSELPTNVINSILGDFKVLMVVERKTWNEKSILTKEEE